MAISFFFVISPNKIHFSSPCGSGNGIQWVTSEIYCSVIGFTQPFFSILATIGINLENGFLFAMQTTYPPDSGSLSFTLIHSLIRCHLPLRKAHLHLVPQSICQHN